MTDISTERLQAPFATAEPEAQQSAREEARSRRRRTPAPLKNQPEPAEATEESVHQIDRLA
jgi:hypothetical protein